MAKRLNRSELDEIGERLINADAYQKWQDEDAERINAMADLARKAGVTVSVDNPPELNADGGYVENEDDSE